MSGAADALRRARGALTDRAFIVFLLVSLTAVWFVGLVVPQRLLVDPAQWEAWRAASPRLVRILEVSGASDVYRAPGTYVLLGFFFLSLCAALWDRLPRLFRRTRLDHGLPLEIAALSRRAGTISIGTADPDRSVASACALLEAEGYSVFVPAPGRARAIRFRHAPLGFVLFHGSFLLLLAGAIVLHATRFSGMATVAEGEEFETAAGPYSARPQQARFGRPRPSLVFTVLEVRPRSRAGHPVSLQVELLVRGDAEPRVADVNEPVTLGPTSLLVMGAGAAPLFACEAGGVGERMYVKLVPDREGRTRFLLDACGLEILARPALPPERESRGQGVMLATAGSANLEGLATAGIEVAVRGLDGWTSRGVLRPGDALASPDGKQILRMPEVRYYASLQVVDERGGWLLWAGFLVGTAGLVMRLLLFRREVVVVADPDGGRVLAGAAADVAGWRADDLLDRIAGRAAGPAGEAPRPT